MFHDSIVKAWTVWTRVGRTSQASGRERRASRRFAPQLGPSVLEGRIALSTITVIPGGETTPPPPHKVPLDEL